MAAEEDAAPGLDSFTEPETGSSNDDGNSIDLEPGEHYIGEITDFSPNRGSHGLLEIDGKDVWLNATLKNQLVSALLRGEQVAYVKSDSEESFEDEDGETQTYNPRSLRFVEGDG